MSSTDEQNMHDAPGYGDGAGRAADFQNAAVGQLDRAPGNIDKIREILFGTNMRDYDARFARLEATLLKESADLRESTRRRFETLEAYLRKELEGLNARVKTEREERADAVGQNSHDLKQAADALGRKIRDVEDQAAATESALRQEVLNQSHLLTDDLHAAQVELTGLLEKRFAELSRTKTDRSMLGTLLTEIGMRINDELHLPVSETNMPESATSRPSSPASRDQGGSGEAELDELRQLIFGRELAQIVQLTKRLDDPEIRAKDLSQILSTSRVRKSLEQAIRRVLKREPDVVIEAIRPVLLLAVKKAVADSFREFSEGLNQIAEKSLSLRSLRWRWEALRTGRKFSDIMLSRSLLYSVREVFLIHGKTGIMLNQAAREAVTKDPDMISSMVSAIQEFVRDSFIGSEHTELETIDAGSLKVWIQHGPHAMVAGAVDGTPPLELKGVFRGALNEIQENFDSALTSFEGDVAPFEGTRPILEKCLLGKSAAKPRKPILLWFVSAACLALLAVWAYLGIQSSRRWNNFLAQLEKQPGIVVTRVEQQGSDHVIFGLRDRFAQDPQELLRGTSIPLSRVHFRFEPYLSLDSAFVARRQLADEEQALEKQVIRFAQGQAELKPADLDEIEGVAAMSSSLIEAARQAHVDAHILVIGHTDEVGSGESNIRLSSQRAERVKADLIAAGTNGSILTARGVATSEPVRTGSSDRDRSFNRSVTFRVVFAR